MFLYNCFDVKRFIVYKIINEGYQREMCIKDIGRNLNSNGEVLIDVSCELYEIKLFLFRLVGGYILQFGYYVYEILGKNNNYKVISISSKFNNQVVDLCSVLVNLYDEGIFCNFDVFVCGL